MKFLMGFPYKLRNSTKGKQGVIYEMFKITLPNKSSA